MFRRSLFAIAVSAPLLAACSVAPSNTIVDVAAGNEDFSALVAAVQAADLVEPLSTTGNYTVFAPTNAAFDALPEGTVAALLGPENKDQLTSILTYHVVAGEIMAADLVGRRVSVKTLRGATIHIDGTDGVSVEGANVVSADIEASNGVIHVIDAVLLP